MNGFRIVEERKGDVSVGFRVQAETYRRAANSEDFGPRWVNRGKRLFTLSDAREYRAWLVKQEQMAKPQTTIFVVE